jgi:PEP-CTERM motif-containing protein
VAGSLAAGDSLGSDSASGSNALAASESPTDSGLGSAGSGSGTSSVPEPSAILLAVLGSIAGFASLLRRRRRQ